jgi:tetratricopeptide (TPR) repeat protein
MAEGRIFESWKEIAEYLRRTPKTCQRWERELGLPVHRLDGSPKASVFAYKEELDSWLNEKLHEKETAGETASRVRPRGRRPLSIVLPVVLGLAATFAAVWVLKKPAPRRPHRVRPEAYEVYRQGRQILNQEGFVATLLPRIEHYFEEATRLDPEFAEAWGELANNRAWQACLGLRPPGEVLPLSREAAHRALALDESTGKAWAALGVISLYFDWNFATAKQELERAVSLTPHDSGVRHAYSDYFLVMGQTAESLGQVRLGREQNPDSLMAQEYIPGHAVAAKRYQEAIDEARAILAGHPEVRNSRHFLAKALWLTGSYEEAIVEFGRLWGPASEQARVLETTFRRGGPRAAMKAVAEHLAAGTDTPIPNPAEVASYYAIAHEADAAFAWLEKAFAQRTPGLLHVPADPFFDPIRKDPRIDDLCRRVGLPIEAWRGSASRVTPPVVPG